MSAPDKSDDGENFYIRSQKDMFEEPQSQKNISQEIDLKKKKKKSKKRKLDDESKDDETSMKKKKKREKTTENTKQLNQHSLNNEDILVLKNKKKHKRKESPTKVLPEKEIISKKKQREKNKHYVKENNLEDEFNESSENNHINLTNTLFTEFRDMKLKNGKYSRLDPSISNDSLKSSLGLDSTKLENMNKFLNQVPVDINYISAYKGNKSNISDEKSIDLNKLTNMAHVSDFFDKRTNSLDKTIDKAIKKSRLSLNRKNTSVTSFNLSNKVECILDDDINQKHLDISKLKQTSLSPKNNKNVIVVKEESSCNDDLISSITKKKSKDPKNAIEPNHCIKTSNKDEHVIRPKFSGDISDENNEIPKDKHRNKLSPKTNKSTNLTKSSIQSCKEDNTSDSVQNLKTFVERNTSKTSDNHNTTLPPHKSKKSNLSKISISSSDKNNDNDTIRENIKDMVFKTLFGNKKLSEVKEPQDKQGSASRSKQFKEIQVSNISEDTSEENDNGEKGIATTTKYKNYSFSKETSIKSPLEKKLLFPTSEKQDCASSPHKRKNRKRSKLSKDTDEDDCVTDKENFRNQKATSEKENGELLLKKSKVKKHLRSISDNDSDEKLEQSKSNKSSLKQKYRVSPKKILSRAHIETSDESSDIDKAKVNIPKTLIQNQRREASISKEVSNKRDIGLGLKKNKNKKHAKTSYKAKDVDIVSHVDNKNRKQSSPGKTINSSSTGTNAVKGNNKDIDKVNNIIQIMLNSKNVKHSMTKETNDKDDGYYIDKETSDTVDDESRPKTTKSTKTLKSVEDSSDSDNEKLKCKKQSRSNKSFVIQNDRSSPKKSQKKGRSNVYIETSDESSDTYKEKVNIPKTWVQNQQREALILKEMSNKRDNGLGVKKKSKSKNHAKSYKAKDVIKNVDNKSRKQSSPGKTIDSFSTRTNAIKGINKDINEVNNTIQIMLNSKNVKHSISDETSDEDNDYDTVKATSDTEDDESLPKTSKTTKKFVEDTSDSDTDKLKFKRESRSTKPSTKKSQKKGRSKAYIETSDESSDTDKEKVNIKHGEASISKEVSIKRGSGLGLKKTKSKKLSKTSYKANDTDIVKNVDNKSRKQSSPGKNIDNSNKITNTVVGINKDIDKVNNIIQIMLNSKNVKHSISKETSDEDDDYDIAKGTMKDKTLFKCEIKTETSDTEDDELRPKTFKPTKRLIIVDNDKLKFKKESISNKSLQNDRSSPMKESSKAYIETSDETSDTDEEKVILQKSYIQNDHKKISISNEMSNKKDGALSPKKSNERFKVSDNDKDKIQNKIKNTDNSSPRTFKVEDINTEEESEKMEVLLDNMLETLIKKTEHSDSSESDGETSKNPLEGSRLPHQTKQETIEEYHFLESLCIYIPFSVVPLHRLVKSLTRTPTREQLEKIAELGLEVKKGLYSPEEDNIIKNNFDKCCRDHNLPPRPELFLNLFIRGADNKRLLKTGEPVKFVQFLAYGLPDRLLRSVNERFKVLFSNLKQGRFSEDEDKLIMDVISTKKYSYGVFTRLGEELNRDHLSVEKRYIWLREAEEHNFRVDKITHKQATFIIEKLLKEMKCDNVKYLKNKNIPGSVFTKIGKELKLRPIKIQQYWLSNLHPKLFVSGCRNMREVKRQLIQLILSDENITKYRHVKYPDYLPHMDGWTTYALSKLLKNIMIITKGLSDNFRGQLKAYLYQVPVRNFLHLKIATYSDGVLTISN